MSYISKNGMPLLGIKLSPDATTILSVDIDVETFEIPNNVTSIHRWAFENCKKIKVLNISNVKHIGFQAFCNCSNLIEVNIPNVMNISYQIFVNCYNLSNIISKLSTKQLKKAFGDEEQYQQYLQRNRDYKLSKLI